MAAFFIYRTKLADGKEHSSGPYASRGAVESALLCIPREQLASTVVERQWYYGREFIGLEAWSAEEFHALPGRELKSRTNRFKPAAAIAES